MKQLSRSAYSISVNPSAARHPKEMRLAFYLDNSGLVGRGPLPDPLLGNPGIGGTEYVFLTVIRLLHDSWPRPLVFFRSPQSVAGIDQKNIVIVKNLADAVHHAEHQNCCGLVFRPGFATADDWPTLENTSIPLLPWLSNLGCDNQARYENLQAVRFWILVSGAQADALRHSRLFTKAVVIPNPVCVPLAQTKPRQLDTAQKASDLAYVGALTPFKGFDRLARAWPSIARRCPDTRLIVFGGADLYGELASYGELTPYEKYCRELLEEGGYSSRVTFAGSCGLDRYQKFSSVAVGVVNPTGRDETFCLAAAEFSACGIPVLAPRRHVFIQTVLDQKTGLLTSNDRDLADFAVRLLHDQEFAWHLGQEGQEYVKTAFSVDVVTAAWQKLTSQLVHNEPVSPVRPTTPWWHEKRWLRQLWGLGISLLGLPSWPRLKQLFKNLLSNLSGLQPLGVTLIAGLLGLFVWFSIVFGKFGGNPTGLARIGQLFPANPHYAPEKLLTIPGKRGNDGQQFLVLAADPLLLDPATAKAVDNPVYRGKRLLLPVLAWFSGLGQLDLIKWTLGLLNVIAIALAAGLVAQWARLEQRDPRWGFSVLALPGVWITLTLSTADMISTTLLIAAAVSWRLRHLSRLSISLAAGLLTRETALLAWLASFISAGIERRKRWLLVLALVPAPLMLVTISLQARFSSTSDGLQAALHFGTPGWGLTQKLGQLLGLWSISENIPTPFEQGFDFLCFLFLLSSLLVSVLAAFRGWGGRWLRLTAALYLLPALCTSTQILARFPDYTRVWIDLSTLSLLALLSSRSRWLPWWLSGAALVSCGYGIGFTFLT